MTEYDRYFAGLIKPKKLTGKMTAETLYEQNFENNCIILSKFTNQPVRTLSVRAYFSLIGYYNEQMKKK